jgi:hypothetical protein
MRTAVVLVPVQFVPRFNYFTLGVVAIVNYYCLQIPEELEANFHQNRDNNREDYAKNIY